MKLSIRYKLLLGFALVLSLSSFVYFVYFNITKDYVYSQLDKSLYEKAETTSEKVSEFISSIELLHVGFARNYLESLGNPNNQNLANIINYSIQENDYLDTVSFLNLTGQEILKYDRFNQIPVAELTTEPSSQALQIALSGEVAYSKIYIPNEYSGPHMSVFSPITSSNNEILGVIKTEIDLSRLWTIMSEIKVGDSGLVYLLDNKGTLIAHPVKDRILDPPTYLDRTIIQYALNGDFDKIELSNSTYLDENSTDVVGYVLAVPELDWIVVVEQPTSEAFAFLNFSRQIFYLTFSGSLIIPIIIALLLSENLTRPILKLQNSTSLLKQGELATRVEIKSGDETEALANSFNTMAEEILTREKSIQTEKQQMEVLLQSLSDGVIAVDQDNKILIFNKAAENITELKSDEVINKNIDEVMPLYQNIEQCLFERYLNKQEEIEEGETKPVHIFTEKGRKVILSLHIKPVKFEQQQAGWLVTFHDITNEQDLEEMKLDFVAMAAHELRTPLTSIRGYLEILMDEVSPKLNEQEQSFLQRTVISSQQLSTLVENLLNVSRIERGNLKLELVPTSIEKLIDSAISNLIGLASEKDISINFHRPQKSINPANMDPFRIGEVISNILTNSIQYTSEGGQIDIFLEEKDQDILVRVKDNGQGIPADSIPHIFTKFYRVAGSLSQGSKGTGLGLFISQAIIDAHKGKIWVESELNVGSEFNFTIPKNLK